MRTGSKGAQHEHRRLRVARDHPGDPARCGEGPQELPLSIQVRERKKGKVYVVHYYDGDKRKYVNRTFFDPTKTDRQNEKDAQAFEAKVLLAKRRGDLDDLDAGTETLAEFVQEWWENYVEPHLAAHTKKSYRYLIDKYILPELGNQQLRRISPRTVSAWATRLDATDTVKRRVMNVLQGILERACEWERIHSNPVKVVKKPAAARQHAVRALPAAAVEALRQSFESERDRALVAVLAYGGLRPGEALALRWEDVGDRSLSITKAIGLGEEKPTKTRRNRQVELSDELRAILLEWKLQSGQREGLVFSGPHGKPWSQSYYDTWRKRVFRPAAPEGMRVYDLRHTRASQLFAEGRNPAWIAEQMGHSLQTLLSTYVHVIEEQNPDRTRADREAASSQ